MDSVQGIGQADYDWIGWQKKSSVSSNISLAFHFDTPRNFTSIRIHTSNLYTRNIYLFHSITITNCESISKKKNDQIYWLIQNDDSNTSARFINIPIIDGQALISNCLNIVLTFNDRSKWILISEVQLDSIPIYTNISKSRVTEHMNSHLPKSIGMNCSQLSLNCKIFA